MTELITGLLSGSIMYAVSVLYAGIGETFTGLSVFL